MAAPSPTLAPSLFLLIDSITKVEQVNVRRHARPINS
jgi:hypothetical protein